MTPNKKFDAGICAIVFGALGVHKFMLGYTREGIIMLLATLVGGQLTCGLSAAAMFLLGFVEGVLYLTKSDAEFASTYIENKRGWL